MGRSHFSYNVEDRTNGNDTDSIQNDCCIEDIADPSDIALSTRKDHTLYRLFKLLMDVSLTAAGVIALSPLFLAIAIAVRADSKGRIFYRQKRCGLNGKLFSMMKFRTMVVDAEKLQKELIPKKSTDGPVFKMVNDPRITRLGRFLRETSLDELPQLYNVLKGEMSLVGPRPLAMEEMTENVSWMRTRLMVKPGITGLWQIKGRGSNLFSDWVKYDIEYVRKRSILLDVKILFLTIPAVLRRHGAH